MPSTSTGASQPITPHSNSGSGCGACQMPRTSSGASQPITPHRNNWGGCGACRRAQLGPTYVQLINVKWPTRWQQIGHCCIIASISGHTEGNLLACCSMCIFDNIIAVTFQLANLLHSESNIFKIKFKKIIIIHWYKKRN